MTLGGSVQVKPAGVEAETVSVTVPVKPFSAVTVMVEVPEAPGNIWLGLTAPAAIVKSVTWNTMVAVLVMEPLVPVTTTEKSPVAAALQVKVAV